jgi:hypothetical protein
MAAMTPLEAGPLPDADATPAPQDGGVIVAHIPPALEPLDAQLSVSTRFAVLRWLLSSVR